MVGTQSNGSDASFGRGGGRNAGAQKSNGGRGGARVGALFGAVPKVVAVVADWPSSSPGGCFGLVVDAAAVPKTCAEDFDDASAKF